MLEARNVRLEALPDSDRSAIILSSYILSSNDGCRRMIMVVKYRINVRSNLFI